MSSLGKVIETVVEFNGLSTGFKESRSDVIADLVKVFGEKLNIREVMQIFTDLKGSGGQLMGRCPFHREKSASLSVSEEKGVYHCFACKRSGNVYGFLADALKLRSARALNDSFEQGEISTGLRVTSIHFEGFKVDF